MTRTRWTAFFDNTCLTINCLLLFLALFGAHLQVPAWLQVAGRMHPLVLHFPIVLLLLAVVWEVVVERYWAIASPSKALSSRVIQRPQAEESEAEGRSRATAHPESVRDSAMPLNDTTQSGFQQKFIGDALLLSAAVSAALAALMGLLLSQEGGYDEATLLWHKWSGVAVSLTAWGWYSFRAYFRAAKMPARLLAATSVTALLMAGHQGATLSHGENYLLAPVAPEKSEPVVAQEDALVYEHLVRPILKEKCMSCHNTIKSKGDLVMETVAGLLKGGKNGLLWDTTAPQLGLMMQRLHLPLDEKEHMPPKGKAQPTEQDIQILELWIKSGGSFTQKIAALPESDPLRRLAVDRFRPAENEAYDFVAADESVVKKLNNDYRAVYPLALHSPALAVDFYGVAAFKSEHLQALEAVREQVATLNLGNMPLQDKDLKTVALFSNLRKLNLSNTPITGVPLGELKNLKHLRSLSLSGTALKISDLDVLRELPELSNLYLWNTSVTAADVENLHQMLPKTHIELGYRGEGVVAKLNAAIIEGGEQVFEHSTKVKLKNYIRGAEVRYTLDGSVPDSLTSPLSTGDSILVEKSGTLSTKTFLPGWLSSEVATRSFYKIGLLPDSVVLMRPPNPQYKGEGPKTLANKKIGDTDFRTNKWMAYRETDLEALFLFHQPVSLSSVSFSSIVDIGSYIMPAAEVQVWGGSSAKNLVLLKKIYPQQPQKIGAPGYRVGFNCTFGATKVSVLKIVAKPVAKLPAWHPGKGERGWVFVDEVFFE